MDTTPFAGKIKESKKFKLENGKRFAFTQTFKSTSVTALSPGNQYRQATDLMLHYYRNIVSEMKLYPEFTKTGQIHFHGWITVKDKYKLYAMTKKINEYLGFYKIKDITSDDDWSDYVTKDWEDMQHVFHVAEPWQFTVAFERMKEAKALNKKKSKNELEGRNPNCDSILEVL